MSEKETHDRAEVRIYSDELDGYFTLEFYPERRRNPVLGKPEYLGAIAVANACIEAIKQDNYGVYITETRKLDD